MLTGSVCCDKSVLNTPIWWISDQFSTKLLLFALRFLYPRCRSVIFREVSSSNVKPASDQVVILITVKRRLFLVFFWWIFFLPSHGAALPINRVGVDALRCDVMLNMFCEKKTLFFFWLLVFVSLVSKFTVRWRILANCFKLSTVIF